MFEKPKPTKGEIEKARRQLDRRVDNGTLRREEGVKGGAEGGSPARWFWYEKRSRTDHVFCRTAGGAITRVFDHETEHTAFTSDHGFG